MKAKRRHELQENVLSAELAQVVNFFKEKGTTLLVALLAVVVIAAIAAYAYGSIRDKRIKLRDDFDRAIQDRSLSPEQRVGILERLSGQDDDKQIAAQAMVALGDEFARRMLVAGPGADSLQWKGFADVAESYYRRAVETYPDQKLSVAKAHYGLAKLAESRKDWDTARAEYQAVCAIPELKDYPVTILAQQALQLVDDLAKPVLMATTAPAEPETQPTTEPATQAAE